MPRNKQKCKDWRRADRDRKMAAKYGPEAVGQDMRGRHGNQPQGEKNGRWNHEGRLLTSHGYIAVRVESSHPRAWGPANSKERYAYEHDLVMEACIGRHLVKGEIVHHVNGDKADNRIENLELESISNHARRHSAAPGIRDKTGRFVAELKRPCDPAEWPADLRVREFPESRK